MKLIFIPLVFGQHHNHHQNQHHNQHNNHHGDTNQERYRTRENN